MLLSIVLRRRGKRNMSSLIRSFSSSFRRNAKGAFRRIFGRERGVLKQILWLFGLLHISSLIASKLRMLNELSASLNCSDQFAPTVEMDLFLSRGRDMHRARTASVSEVRGQAMQGQKYSIPSSATGRGASERSSGSPSPDCTDQRAGGPMPVQLAQVPNPPKSGNFYIGQCADVSIWA